MVLLCRILLKSFWTLPNNLCCCKHCDHGQEWARNVKELHVARNSYQSTPTSICFSSNDNSHSSDQWTSNIGSTRFDRWQSSHVFSTLAHRWWSWLFFPVVDECIAEGKLNGQDGKNLQAAPAALVYFSTHDWNRWLNHGSDWYSLVLILHRISWMLQPKSLFQFYQSYLVFFGRMGSMENLKGQLWSCGQPGSKSASTDRSNGMWWNARGCWLKWCWMQRSLKVLKVPQMLMK